MGQEIILILLFLSIRREKMKVLSSECVTVLFSEATQV